LQEASGGGWKGLNDWRRGWGLCPGGGGGGGWAPGRERECRRHNPRRHLPLGSHSAPKCPFPRPAAAECLGCGSGGAGGGTRSGKPSPGGGQTWWVRIVLELHDVWLQLAARGGGTQTFEGTHSQWRLLAPTGPLPLYPLHPPKRSFSHHLESSVFPGGDGSERPPGASFSFSQRQTPSREENQKHLLPRPGPRAPPD
jgi:hypothetical protein